MEVVILVGLPASGKSSFYRERYHSTHLQLSKDFMGAKTGKQQRLERLLRQALEEGRSVVVDNTNPHSDDRRPLIELARLAGARVVGFYFSSRLEECSKRNELRTGKARVPEVALMHAASRLQRPGRDEGFDELYYVELRETFEVSAWHED